MVLNDYNINTVYGNTIRLRLTLERDGGFGENDKVLLKVRRGSGEEVYSRLLKIVDDAVYFMLDAKEAKGITFGEHLWDITVYINAQDEGGEIIADEVITPFVNAKFNVQRQASREVD